MFPKATSSYSILSAYCCWMDYIRSSDQEQFCRSPIGVQLDADRELIDAETKDFTREERVEIASAGCHPQSNVVWCS